MVYERGTFFVTRLVLYERVKGTLGWPENPVQNIVEYGGGEGGFHCTWFRSETIDQAATIFDIPQTLRLFFKHIRAGY